MFLFFQNPPPPPGGGDTGIDVLPIDGWVFTGLIAGAIIILFYFRKYVKP
jgi:hypothetical protein